MPFAPMRSSLPQAPAEHLDGIQLCRSHDSAEVLKYLRGSVNGSTAATLVT